MLGGHLRAGVGHTNTNPDAAHQPGCIRKLNTVAIAIGNTHRVAFSVAFGVPLAHTVAYDWCFGIVECGAVAERMCRCRHRSQRVQRVYGADCR